MPSLDLYLEELDTSTALATLATFDGATHDDMAAANTNLYYQAPLADFAAIFKFFTDDSNDVTAEGVSLMTEQGLDFIGDTAAAANSASVAALYAASTETLVVNAYTTNVINDIGAAVADDTCGDAGNDFLKELVRTILGSPLSVDMLTNEAALGTAFGVAVEVCATAISSNFNTAGSAALHGAIGDSVTTTSLVVCKKIYDQMRNDDIERFTLAYTAAIGSGAPVDQVGCAVTGGAAQSGSPTVDVLMNAAGTAVDGIEINVAGGGFVKGDSITITTTTVAGTITIASLTDVQAHMLNGTLNATAGTELPLLANDVFHIQLSISSHASQTTANTTVMSTANGNLLTRTVDLYIKLA
jgi:hypothetical protein